MCFFLVTDNICLENLWPKKKKDSSIILQTDMASDVKYLMKEILTLIKPYISFGCLQSENVESHCHAVQPF
jgi:hypothetical protein